MAEPVQEFCRRAATGRLAQGESDAVVVMAALAEAEGDAEHARQLLMSPMNPRTPASHLAMHAIAARLGIGDELIEIRRAATADGSNRDLTVPMQTLRAELERRGWLE